MIRCRLGEWRPPAAWRRWVTCQAALVADFWHFFLYSVPYLLLHRLLRSDCRGYWTTCAFKIPYIWLAHFFFFFLSFFLHHLRYPRPFTAYIPPCNMTRANFLCNAIIAERTTIRCTDIPFLLNIRRVKRLEIQWHRKSEWYWNEDDKIKKTIDCRQTNKKNKRVD